LRYKKKFHRKPKEKSRGGLVVKVYNNNVEGALKILKKKVKKSNLMLELRKREFFEKPSDTRRHKRQMARLRQRYQSLKEKENN